MKRQHINMNNYEEYFLLYVDNELTAAEKASVEAFVMQHPELRPELDMFLDTKLDLEAIEFEGKDELLRSGSEINEDNVEEFQVQMIDGELEAQKAAELEAYHLTHKKAADNFEWLKKAKLPQENIVFPDKATLYRHEKKPATVISFSWTRIAVAASVVLIAGLIWLQQTNNTGTIAEPELASAENGATAPANKVVQDTNDKEQVSPLTEGTNEKITSGSLSADRQNNNVVITKDLPQRNQERGVTYATVDRNNNTVEEQKGAEGYSVATGTIAEKPAVDLNVSEPSVAMETVAMNVKTNYVTEALEVDHPQSSDDYGDEEHGKRKGLRGLVRKVNRIYNKATNPDPEKAIVKVASFEIGLPR